MPKSSRSSLSRRTGDARRQATLRLHETADERQSRLFRQRHTDSMRRASNITPQEELQYQVAATLKNRSAFEYNLHLDYSHCKYLQIGAMDKICSHCKAKKWKDEAPGMCCAGGKVSLPNIELPDPLKTLVLGTHPSSNDFLNNVRKYNTLFQMTSFGAKIVIEGNFMPTFKIQGQVYHRIGSLFPASGNTHQFLQIYLSLMPIKFLSEVILFQT